MKITLSMKEDCKISNNPKGYVVDKNIPIDTDHVLMLKIFNL